MGEGRQRVQGAKGRLTRAGLVATHEHRAAFLPQLNNQLLSEQESFLAQQEHCAVLVDNKRMQRCRAEMLVLCVLACM